VHEEFIAVDGLVTGDRRDGFHRPVLLPSWLLLVPPGSRAWDRRASRPATISGCS
jgi:hypothetical protein